ncbi:N/A [soil metagenome]
MTFEYANPRQSPPERNNLDWLLKLATFIWQAFMGIILPASVGVSVGFAASPALGVLMGLLTAILIFITARSSQLARRRRALIVLSHVDTTVRMNMPLPTTIRRWGEAETRKVSVLLSRVADHLERGEWVSEAMRRAEVDLPARVFDQLAAAESAGRLSHGIGQVLEEERIRRTSDPGRGRFVRVYSIILLVVIPSICALIAIFVMPRYAQIMKDFRIPMPVVAKWMIAITQSVSPILVALGVILFVLASQVAVAEITSITAHKWTGIFRRVLDRLRWVTPIIGRMDRDRGMADVCQTVAEALDAQRPLDAAVAEAYQPHLNIVLAARVARWSNELARGLSPGEAAAAAHLPELVSGMLGRVRAVPNIATTLRFLEQYYRSRFSRLRVLLREAGLPLLALVGGLCVVFVALSIFTPMIALIEVVSLPQIRP